jgi:hypothetical protein
MTRIILPFAALLTSLIVISCDDDENETGTIVQRNTAQFEQSTLSLSEISEATKISIAFSRNAAADGELHIQVSSSNIQMFQLDPLPVDGIIKLPFLKGQSKVSFDVKPINNDALDGDKTLDFTIVSLPTGYDIGTVKTLKSVWIDDESPAKVSFDLNTSQAREDISDGYAILIRFSHAANANGVVRISMESLDAVYGTHFTTSPAASNGIITLLAQPGNDYLTFSVIPSDDELYNDLRSITYTIADVEGGLEKGGRLQHELKITDDELEGTAKGYEVIGGGWSYKRRYEYNENGTISKIYWDQNTPGHTGGVYTYVYNAGGQVEKIIQSTVREEIYLREGERIVRSEQHTNGVLTAYTLYGYDVAGNVAEEVIHYRQQDGSLKLGMHLVYLYHTDHNVYKVLVYTIPANSDEEILSSTKTYDFYLDAENPFPMVDILPDQKSQHNLPASYRVEENGHDITYQLTYEFNNEGKPLTRTATSPSGRETASYEYY